MEPEIFCFLEEADAIENGRIPEGDCMNGSTQSVAHKNRQKLQRKNFLKLVIFQSGIYHLFKSSIYRLIIFMRPAYIGLCNISWVRVFAVRIKFLNILTRL